MSLQESDLQRAVMLWCGIMESKFPCLKWMHAIPNGGKRDSKEASSMKSQGVKAGILDLSLDVARGGFHGLKIELKKPGGKCLKPSKEQLEYIEFCRDQGYSVLVSNDFDEVKAFILDYLNANS